MRQGLRKNTYGLGSRYFDRYLPWLYSPATGRQTIYQMMRLAEEARKHGGTPCDPLDYKWQYLNLLQGKITHRLVTLRPGS